MTATAQRTVGKLVEALATNDAQLLAEILDPGVLLRALLPSRTVDVTGVAEATAEMLDWFGDVAEIVPVTTTVEELGDLWHAGYRFLLHETGKPEQVAEQHAYCVVEGDRITRARVICSGFRPARVR